MIFKFEDFLNENKVDSYIDFKTTDMLSDYKMLNTKLFNSELEIVPLKWMKNKTKLGVMSYNREIIIDSNGKKQVKETINGVKISTFYQLTRQQYLDVLAHEMIHVCISQKGIKDNNDHGRRFTAMKDDINRKFPEFSVKQSENADDYAVSTPNNVIKELGAIVFKINEDDYSIIVVNEKMVEDRVLLDGFAEKFKGIISMNFPTARTMTMTVYKAKIPALAKFKVKRTLSFKSLELFTLNDTLRKQLEASSKIMEVKLK
jgi:hypothetical protein